METFFSFLSFTMMVSAYSTIVYNRKDSFTAPSPSAGSAVPVNEGLTNREKLKARTTGKKRKNHLSGSSGSAFL